MSHQRHFLSAMLGWLMVIATVSAVQAADLAEPIHSWPVVTSIDGFEVAPMTEKRIGFTLTPRMTGRRVIVAIRAFCKSARPSGYSMDALAIDVNGETMNLNVDGRPRLINRPMKFAFGAKAERLVSAGKHGTAGLGANVGSARWTLPWTSTIDAWLKSEDYKPVGLQDPVWLAIDVTDLTHPDSFNYVLVKNESKTATILVEATSIRYERDRVEVLEAKHLELHEKHFGRGAIQREPTKGREWVYDMDLISSGHGSEGSMANIQNLEDARRLIRPLKADGYDTVIVSGLHMRYTYTKYWESRVLPFMKFVCQAAHEAGMRVIDHYDVPIFYARGYQFLLEADHLEWTQRDIRYGTPTRMYCINNPGFRKHFFDFTRRVQQESRIDGYQIDEIYFFEKSFCGCESCRSQFKADTGFVLPREADSSVFFNDTDPLWRLFLLWRQISMKRFKQDFIHSIRQVNPAAILSTYTTTHYAPARRGGAWPGFLVSYAVGKEGVTRLPMHDYRYALADFKIYTGVADVTGHATWMLWYPLTGSAARFCWAISQASNCGQWHSRTWSSAVRDLIAWPHKSKKFDFTTFADVAMVFSERSKSTSQRTGHYHGMESLGWGQAMIENNIQYHNIHETAVTADLLSRYRLVILPQMTVIDDACHEALETWVRGGGTLLVAGETGLIDERGRPLPDFALRDMMNLRLVDVINAPFKIVESETSFDFAWERMAYKYGARMLEVAMLDPSRSRVHATFHKGTKEYPGVVETTCGEGRVVTLPTFLGVSNFKLGLQEGSRPIFRTNPDATRFMARLIRNLLGVAETISPTDLPQRIVYTTWMDKFGRGEIQVHVLNVSDFQEFPSDQPLKRRELKFPLVEDEMSLSVRGYTVSSAVFYSPDTPAATKCRIEVAQDGSSVTIPGRSMKMYGLLKLQTTKVNRP